jgi:uncharacterized membrane protein YfcA
MFGFTSIVALALATLIVAMGAALQTSVGFGLALFAAPLLNLIDPKLVPGPLIIAMMIVLVTSAVRERDAMDLRGVGWVLAGRLPGALLGALALRALAPGTLSLAIGILVLVAVGLSLYRGGLPRSRPMLVGAGLVSGVMGTTAAIGGPAVAVLYQRESGPLVRSTLAGYFIVGAVMSLVALFLVDRLGREEVVLGLAMMPGIVLGIAVADPARRFLDRGYTRNAILLVSAAAGLSAVVRGLVWE